MKKMMMAVAIVCAAYSLNAASVSWLAYQYKGGYVSDNIQDYGYFVDATGNPYTSNPAGIDLCLCLMSGDAVSQVLSVGANDGSGAVSGFYQFEYATSVIKNGDILKVMFRDGDGKFTDLVAAANADGMDPTVINSLTVSGLSDDSWTNDEFVYATGNFTQAIPEPTCGLLLLFGMGALALRRKQK